VRDEMRLLAVERCLAIISEAAVKLGADAEQDAPEIPWRDVRGMGNHLRHGYETVDHGIVWETVQNELPALRRACEAALRRLETDE